MEDKGEKRYTKYKESYEKYRKENKEKINNLNKVYRQNNKDKIKELKKIWREKKYFDGKRDLILERDNWMCIECGMTQEQHILIFNRSLTVDHIDGNGRYSEKPNNNINNLQTLCLRCHGKKDILRHSQFKNKKQTNGETSSKT